ncbi:PTS lactose/cellobiose transporter subunit IIA [Aerococcus viridans]
MNEDQLQDIMMLIMNAGEAKSCAMEAIKFAKQYDFEAADEKMTQAKEALNLAHNSQTALLTKEAQGESVELSLLMIHSQDHLMTAITFRDLAVEVIDIYKVLNA